MKKILFAYIFLMSGFIFSQENDSTKIKQAVKEIDSIEYSEKDFVELKKLFTKDKSISDSILKKTGLEGNIELDLLELLELSYEDAKIKYGERNVKMMIYTHYKSREILEKFKKLDSTFQAKNDSLEKQKKLLDKKIELGEELEKELEKYRKQQDSLKKN